MTSGFVKGKFIRVAGATPGNVPMFGTNTELVDSGSPPGGGGGGGGATNLTASLTATTVTVESSTGLDALIPAATGSAAGVFTAANFTKLSGIESGATADQTNTEILNAWEAATGRTAADDGTKLDGIESLADVTDAMNVNAAGAVMESDTSTATFAFVIDDDSFATASATTVASSESVKALVDAAVIGAGAGDVVGPASAVDEQIAVYDGTTGKLLKDGGIGVALISTAIQPSDNISELTNDSAFITIAAVSGSYEPIDATIIRQANIDDVAVNGVTTAPISSNWAYDHENNTANPHNVTAAQIGVEAGADVTDTANVTAAGALMDSEVTNLADVKAFDAADYATASQGATADSALQAVDVDDTPVNGATTDPVSSNWAFDHAAAADPHPGYQLEPSEGAFANGDKTKLDGIESLADVTDAANVNAAGAVMNSDTSTAAMAFVIDDDTLATALATNIVTGEAIKAYIDAQTVTPKQVFKSYGFPDTTNPVVEELIGGVVLSKFNLVGGVGSKTTFMETCGIDTGVSHKFTMKCVSENDENGDECAFEISIRNRSDDPQGVGAYDTANASGDVALAADNDTEFTVSTTITNWDGVTTGDVMQFEVERVDIADGTEATGGIYLLGMILEPV